MRTARLGLNRIVFKVLLFCLLGNCFLGAQTPPKIEILTSIFPFYEFARAVCGERGKVEILIPPGAEVHTWKPKPSDIIKLTRADLFIGVGSVLEPWLDDIIHSAKNPELVVVRASQFLLLEKDKHESHGHSQNHEGVDPHLWLNFEYDIQIVEQLRGILSQIDPSYADVFRTNAEKYIQRLAALDKKYSNAFSDCSTRTFIVGGHSAFGYLARRYNLNQVAVYGMNPDSQPSPRKLIDIIRMAKEKKIKVIFYEFALNDEIARMIAGEVGAKILPLNPGANVSREEVESGVSFFGIMETNLENFKIGLSCR